MPDADTVPERDLPPPIANAPPTAGWVWSVLRREGPATPSKLRELLPVAERTLQGALARLEDHDLVAATSDPDDPRRTRYSAKRPDE
jgi:DNA-binding HxlR family transcriptional regulator